MERCRGKTKAGVRCKRARKGDSDFCDMHAGQAQAPPGASRARAKGSDGAQDRREDDYDDIDRLWGLATIAVIVCGLLLLKGGSRLW